MNISRLASSLSAAGLLLMPLSAFAHETQQFMIGDKNYQFVVGSLNEPVTVDDKSGVELSVSLAGHEDPEDEDHDETQPHDHEALAPVTGLEQTLKVEISAGDKKKEMALTTIYGEPGSYKAVFFPTVQTTLTYRFFGTIDGQAVDLSFTCNPAGHPATPEDTTKTKISDSVTRTLKRGAFGCPSAKADLGFPEPSATLQDLRSGSGGSDWGMAGVILGAVGCIAGIGAWVRKK